MRKTKRSLWLVALAIGLTAAACDDGGGDSDGGGGGRDGGGGGGTDAGGGGGTDAGGGGSNAQFCQEECSIDDDCQIGGMDVGFTCSGGRCTGSASGCTGNEECVALFNGWGQGDSDGDFIGDAPCTADGVTPPATCATGEVCCIIGQVCIEGGYCASPDSGPVDCATSMRDVVMVAPIGGGADIAVCGDASADDAVCESNACRNPCASNDECASDVYPTCDTGSGNCVCSDSPDSCAGNMVGGTVCQSNGTCGCADDTECTGTGQDHCYDGVCGCDAVASCPSMTAFDGTTYVCE
ncbi:MAG: hypothetical protein AB7S26_23155 [Sandaracinaceae bacterium]